MTVQAVFSRRFHCDFCSFLDFIKYRILDPDSLFGECRENSAKIRRNLIILYNMVFVRN